MTQTQPQLTAYEQQIATVSRELIADGAHLITKTEARRRYENEQRLCDFYHRYSIKSGRAQDVASYERHAAKAFFI